MRASWVTVISVEFMSDMTEHSTSASGMNWDCGTGDICTGDRSPDTHTHTQTQIILGGAGQPAAEHTNTPGPQRSAPLSFRLTHTARENSPESRA